MVAHGPRVVFGTEQRFGKPGREGFFPLVGMTCRKCCFPTVWLSRKHLARSVIPRVPRNPYSHIRTESGLGHRATSREAKAPGIPPVGRNDVKGFRLLKNNAQLEKIYYSDSS